GGREVLREERTEGLVLPSLDITCRPVIDEAEAEDVIERLVRGDRRAERVAASDECAELELVVEALRRAESRWRIRVVPRLSVRPFDRCAADDDRRSAAVIADRDPLVIRQQWIVRTELRADPRGVMNGCVEVG